MKTALILALTAAISVPAALADPPPAKINPAQFDVIEQVVVPVPSEIFAVLDKLGKPNWAGVLRAPKGVAAPTGDQAQVALQLGVIIAEGFVAVEAQDAAAVKDIGKSVLNLATALGVKKAVTTRANAIINAADKADWAAVRKELDGSLSEVKEAMSQINNANLSHLVSLGGWLRGTEALCQVVQKNYSKDGADLLHQPRLLTHFTDILKVLPKKIATNPVIIRAKKDLAAITPLITLSAGAGISEKSVKEIGDIAAGLVKAIQTK